MFLMFDPVKVILRDEVLSTKTRALGSTIDNKQFTHCKSNYVGSAGFPK